MISRPDLSSGKGVIGFHRGSAPELVRPQKPGKPATRITKASDIYAFGMLIWEVGIILPHILRSKFAYYKARHVSDLLREYSIL